MTGSNSSIRVDCDDIEVQAALERLFKAVKNTRPMMSEIAEYLHERTREHFDNETDPDGNAWFQSMRLREARQPRLPRRTYDRSFNPRACVRRDPFTTPSDSSRDSFNPRACVRRDRSRVSPRERRLVSIHAPA